MHFPSRLISEFVLAIYFALFATTLCFGQEPANLRAGQKPPLFPGCEQWADDHPRKKTCSEKALADFIAAHLVYPDSAARAGISGTVVLSFVVDVNGRVIDGKILRDIGGGCGAAALRLLDKMPAWEPCVHQDKAVKVRLTLPIEFAFKRELTDDSDQFSLHWGGLEQEEVEHAQLLKALEDTPIIRDAFGVKMHVRKLDVFYEKGKKTLRHSVEGDEMDKNQHQLVEEAESGGLITLEALIDYGENTLSVRRSYKVR